jgi:DNA-binding SARP family transcriptional activator/DNA-binding XRE family transcriptional regulator
MGSGNSNTASDFGFWVRSYRREAGLTQRELAAKAGLSIGALRDIEQSRRTRPKATSLASLVSALKLSPAQTANLTLAATLPGRRHHALPPSRSRPAGSGHTPEAGTGVRGRGLWCALLGPLEAFRDGLPLHLGPPARRVVLGLLLMKPGSFVRRDTIIGVLWGEAPPATAIALVQAHVSRIRKLLSARDDGRALIDSSGGAYRLRLTADEADLLAFRELSAQAAMSRAGGDDVMAAELYERAISLWRGEPFADVELLSRHRGAVAMRQELTEALLRYAEVARGLGQHHRVLSRLRAAAEAEPLNEEVHASLMITLAGQGQQAAAVWVYQELRSRLHRELGLSPAAVLTQAYAGVMRQDFQARALPALAAVIPRQLPAAQPGFTGRLAVLAELSALAERYPTAARGAAIVAFTGTAGVGKTALAVHCAHQVADRFPDGQLFVNLRGSGSSEHPVSPTDALRDFLAVLGVPAGEIPTGEDRLVALYRSLLADRCVLIVLDDAAATDQLRPLLPGSMKCLVLVTSRTQLTGLATTAGAHMIRLGVLAEAESRSLLASQLGAERTAAEPTAVDELITLCGGLPGALREAAASAAGRPGVPLADLVAGMRERA